MKRFCLIANPAAGRTRNLPLLSAVRALLDRSGLDHDLKISPAPGLAITLALAAAEEGYEGVIAYGGDGTLSEVASGIVESGLTLGILPGGTMNLFARELGIPVRLEEAVKVLAAGKTRRVEVGRVAGRTFLLCASAGVDAAIVRAVKSGTKKRIGKFPYYLRAPRVLWSYPFPAIRLVTGDGITLHGGEVIVSNGIRYGDRYPIAPGASPFDGVMDACVFLGRLRRNYVRYWAGVRRGRHLLEDDVEYYKGTSFLLRPATEGTAIPFQVDGDYLCDLPVEIRVIPSALPIFVPSESSLPEK